MEMIESIIDCHSHTAKDRLIDFRSVNRVVVFVYSRYPPVRGWFSTRADAGHCGHGRQRVREVRAGRRRRRCGRRQRSRQRRSQRGRQRRQRS